MDAHKIEMRLQICHELERLPIDEIDVDTELKTDVFASHMLFIVSKHKRRHGFVKDWYIEKLKRCIEQINNSTEHKRHQRTFEIYEEHGYMAFLRNRPPSVGTEMFTVSMSFERIDGKWHVANEETRQMIKRRVVLVERLSK